MMVAEGSTLILTSTVGSYLKSLSDNSFHSYKSEESWEDIDLEHISYFDRGKHLRTVYFRENRVFLEDIQLLLETTPVLESIHFIHIDLQVASNSFAWTSVGGMEPQTATVAEGEEYTHPLDQPFDPFSSLSPSDPTRQRRLVSLCEQFLFLFFSHFSSGHSRSTGALTLLLAYCPWVEYQLFKDFLSLYILPSISKNLKHELSSAPSKESSEGPKQSPPLVIHIIRLAEENLLQDDLIQQKWLDLSAQYQSMANIQLFVDRIVE
jgi:hypothetical protein